MQFGVYKYVLIVFISFFLGSVATAEVIYSGLPQISILDSVKAPGLSDRKSPNIGNMGRLTIAQPRELSRCPKSKFEAGQSIHVNTSNLGKLEEYKEYFSPKEVISQSKDLREPKSDPLTIIQYKASQFEEVLVDDVALDIEGVDVGVNIRWFLKEIHSPKYIGKRCTYSCLIGIRLDDKVKVYRGVVKGKLVEPRGDCFGFGRYFLPDGTDKTLGEFMNPEFNARYLAIQNFKEDKPYTILPVLKEWPGEFQD